MEPRLKHNPSHLGDAALLRDFVVRQVDLDLIVERLHEPQGASNQHLLIRGPHGAGKTTLVNRVIAELRRDPALAERWVPIAFDEESYTVTSAAELWLQTLVHLGEQTRDPGLMRVATELRGEADITRLRDRALARLGEFAAGQDKRLVVVVENVDMLFEQQMSDEDGWDLRHTLQNEPWLMMLATSTTRLRSFHDPRRPLYELFWEHVLEPLHRQEIAALWRMVSDTDLDPRRARAIEILTGGSARLVVILAASARGRSFRALMSELIALVDESTPTFKHTIERLPPEERKIFITLADLWSPSTSRQVAERARSDIRKTSALLGRLERRGVIEEVGRIDNTRRYQVAERMLNLYHLLRRRDHARVGALVDFIIAYFEGDDARSIQAPLPELADAACEVGAAAFGWPQGHGPDGPAGADAQLRAVSTAIVRGRWDAAWTALGQLLGDPGVTRGRLSELLPWLLVAAARGQATPLRETLEGSASAVLLGPLVVALRGLDGLPVDAPQEVREVAEDIVERLAQARGAPAKERPQRALEGAGEDAAAAPPRRRRRP